MCTVSMIYEHYDRIPNVEPYPFYAPFTPSPSPTTGIQWPNPSATLDELRKLIADFREAAAAAKVIDEKTGQPDCFDPNKSKLEDRVRELEKLLAAPPEFVIVDGGTLEPGRYRVIDGRLYKAVEAAP